MKFAQTNHTIRDGMRRWEESEDKQTKIHLVELNRTFQLILDQQ